MTRRRAAYERKRANRIRHWARVPKSTFVYNHGRRWRDRWEWNAVATTAGVVYFSTWET